MKRELLWFLIAGFSAVGTDMSTYYALKLVFPVSIAKAISFILGSIVAYVINKYKTFQKQEANLMEVFKFATLYVSTLGANVLVNKIVLIVFPMWFFFAFLCATATSTILNYLGQKFWVFKK